MAQHISAVKNLIMNEVNVKEVELIEDTTGIITKRIKPNFKTLGPRYGKYMKQIAAMTAEFSQERIAQIEAAAQTVLDLGLKNHRNPGRFRDHLGGHAGMAGSIGRQTYRSAGHYADGRAPGGRRGTRVDKPHPKYP